ncbi:MAG: hypothetical protein M2R45_00721 [Verrucomicrobia subdivision 3 bacterium]|nr:hypothetical protein [Limisphaerales bacterium]MCS1414396.1 hypothetical protein [Limisphaerales bacterium]
MSTAFLETIQVFRLLFPQVESIDVVFRGEYSDLHVLDRNSQITRCLSGEHILRGDLVSLRKGFGSAFEAPLFLMPYSATRSCNSGLKAVPLVVKARICCAAN